MSLHSPRLLFLFFSLVALGLAGCDSSSDSDADAPDGGDSADLEYGINIVNTGTEDLEVSYAQAFCQEEESQDDCRASVSSFGTRTASPGGNAIGGIDTPDEGEVIYYIEWEVRRGAGRIEFATVNDTDNGTFVDEVIDSFEVTAGDEGSNFFPIE